MLIAGAGAFDTSDFGGAFTFSVHDSPLWAGWDGGSAR